MHLRTRPNGMDGEWSEFEEHFDWSVVIDKSFECSFELLMSAQLHRLPPSDEGFEDNLRSARQLLESAA